MNRVQFLDAQLWLRRARATDWRDDINGNDTAEPTRKASCQLLPPRAGPATTSESAATAWCCFHVGSRFCFFAAGDADDDPTQFQLELQVRNSGSDATSCELLARFDTKHVFAVDLRRVCDLVLPKPAVPLPHASDATDASPASQEQHEALPFGSLEFQNVSLRVWMDPQLVPPASARHILQHALVRIQQLVLHARQVATQGVAGASSPQDISWRNAFRFTKRLAFPKRSIPSNSSSSSSTALSRMTPAALLVHARRIFKRDADVEAVKLASAQIVRDRKASRSSRARSESGEDAQRRVDDTPLDASHVSAQDETPVGDRAFSDNELMQLLAELAHIFGDDHDGVNELLGFSAASACAHHDRCFLLSGSDASASPDDQPVCVSAKWQAWDEYLEAAARATTATAPSSSTVAAADTAPSGVTHAAIHAAATAFQRAVVTEQDTHVWHERVKRQREQIEAFERVGFDAFFPSDDDVVSLRKWKRLHDARMPDAQQLQQQHRAEQMFGVLLEKRKQLVRDELAGLLLPSRSHSDAHQAHL